MHKIPDILRNNISTVLNSYSVVFFFNNRLMGMVLLIVTFFNFWSGLSGLIAVVISIMIAIPLGFDRKKINKGILSFNALLTGIGMGTFFEPGPAYFYYTDICRSFLLCHHCYSRWLAWKIWFALP